MDFYDLAKKMLLFDEDSRKAPYKDHLGNWTIGVGHLIGPKIENLSLCNDAINAQLEFDLNIHIADLHILLGSEFFESLSLVRKAALADLAFTMSRGSLSSFKEMIKAIKEGDWDRAAHEVLNSKWSRDVDPQENPLKGRDNRIAYMLKTDQIHPDYKE